VIPEFWVGIYEQPEYDPKFKSMTVNPTDGSQIFIATHPGDYWPFVMWRTDDRGISWTSLNNYVFPPDAPKGWVKQSNDPSAQVYDKYHRGINMPRVYCRQSPRSSGRIFDGHGLHLAVV